ncbi:21857_t:CDS:2 [Dentiscutata erythropus]|uniref:21857_t:CDS:1 n=1 Tax=Dentiscutata erythropus TaxID=1348616 RepID=A0A9N9GSZ3_9GLOM|nr:21857_t:CDS:2 [Dentiscutata erythropus]
MSLKNTKKALSTPITKNNIDPIDVDNIDDDIHSSSHEINESPPRLPLSESFTNTLENLSVVSNEESKTMKLILEMAKQVLTQNDSLIEKQESLEALVTQLVSDVKILQSSHEDFKSNIKDHGAVQGIKNVIDNWLYPNNKIYKQAIRKELEALCLDKMCQYKKDTNGNYHLLRSKIHAEFCKYRGALFGSFRRAIFDYVFKKKVLPIVNSESSESEIISWKVSEEVQWCFGNLDTMIKDDDKTYLQIVAKKVFGRLPTKNQYAVT